MDLRLFHPTGNPNSKPKVLDYWNSRTGLFACRFLEWSGSYNDNVKRRLLGHYRLYQLYKKRRSRGPSALPPVQGYILQYRASHWIKHYWYLALSRLPSMFMPDPGAEMYLLNKILVYQRAPVLYEFLENADMDFEQAFNKALGQINNPEFLHPIVEKEINTTIKEIIVKESPPTKDLNGKDKGVFSKKQVLILFDLLAQAESIESLPIEKAENHRAISQFLHAVTGRSVDTWLDTLKDYQNGDLYSFNTRAERTNLIATITGISKDAHAAGLRILAGEAEKKIRQLRRKG